MIEDGEFFARIVSILMNREINKRFCAIFTYDVVSKLVPLHIKPAVIPKYFTTARYWLLV
jgi:hypothetical protein